MNREPIGEIACPWCERDAELHQSEDRPKLNPDAGAARPSYPKKYFVVCPPVKGYRGCGTTLANNAEAQARMMDKGRVFGVDRKKNSTPRQPASSRDEPATTTAPPAPSPPAPTTGTGIETRSPAPPAKKTSFTFW